VAPRERKWVAFQKACGTPRGFATTLPGPASNVCPPTPTPNRPLQDERILVLVAVRVHESSERTRRKRVLEEREVAVARLGAEQEDRARRTCTADRPLDTLPALGVSISCCQLAGAAYPVTVILSAVWTVSSDRCDWFSGRRRADSSIPSHRLRLDQSSLCRPSPPEDLRRDLIGAWHRPQ
jgi:hypothetical protein